MNIGLVTTYANICAFSTNNESQMTYISNSLISLFLLWQDWKYKRTTWFYTLFWFHSFHILELIIGFDIIKKIRSLSSLHVQHMLRQSLAVDQSLHRKIKIKYTCIRIFDVIVWCQSLLFFFFAVMRQEMESRNFKRRQRKSCIQI